MLKKTVTFFGALAGLGFLLGILSGAIAAEIPTQHITDTTSNTHQFQRIEQPLGSRVTLTLSGLSLIGLELWWFLLSKPKPQ